MAWGIGWGLGWGAALPSTPFSILRARARTGRSVRVTFTVPPLFVSPAGEHDASNLDNWSLARLDPGGDAPGLLAARAVAGDPQSIELVLVEPYATSELAQYRITGSNLWSAALDPLGDPSSADFLGMPTVVASVRATQPLADLKNPQTSPTRLNGALVVGPSGDYLEESGVSLIKKLIFRRLLTARDEYYHLAGTDYGAGLGPKQIFRPADLIVLRTQLEAQVLREAEVAAVSIDLALTSSGELTVGVRARLRSSDQQLSFQFPVSANG